MLSLPQVTDFSFDTYDTSWPEGGKYICWCGLVAGGYLSCEAFSAGMTTLIMLQTPIQLYGLLKGISD
jgi:hypothetical protein